MDSTRYWPSITAAVRARRTSSPTVRYTCHTPACKCLPKNPNGSGGATGFGGGGGGGGGGVHDRAPKACAPGFSTPGRGAGRRSSSANTATAEETPATGFLDAGLACTAVARAGASAAAPDGVAGVGRADRVGATRSVSAPGVLSAKNASQAEPSKAISPSAWRSVMVLPP